MSDYTDLCAGLRRKGRYFNDTKTFIPDPLADEAASALEAQAREIEELRATLHAAWNDRDEYIKERDVLRARAEAAEGLLRECSGLLGDSSTVKFPLPRGYIDGWRARWDELSARVAVHFDQVKP